MGQTYQTKISSVNQRLDPFSPLLPDGWAVDKEGAINRYEGTRWKRFAPPTCQDLNAVHMVSSTDGWAVGDKGVLLRYECTSWTTVPSPATERLNDISFVNPRYAWVVGKFGTFLNLSAPQPPIIAWREIF